MLALARSNGGGDGFQYLGFYCQYHDVAVIYDLLIIIGGVNAEVGCQRGLNGVIWVGDTQGPSGITGTDQPADETAGHVATTNKTDCMLMLVHDCIRYLLFGWGSNLEASLFDDIWILVMG